ncbi:MAG TPA: HAMP domain-containing sensor histidine kinase [Acidimicrobiales bacterium]|nr:HAMP domain-containing sensor histidine kinase [Acidimicrobiales bacterium]
MAAEEGGSRWARPARGGGAQAADGPRGSDRRPFTGPLLLALAITGLTWGVFAALDAGGYGATEAMASVNDILDTSTTVIAVVVGALVLLRWRLLGERRDIAVGVGLVILGAVFVGFDELVLPRLPVGARDDTLVELVPPLGFVVGLLVLALPVFPLPGRLRDRLRTVPPARAGVMALFGLAVLTTVLVLSPATAEILAGRREGTVPSAGQAVAHALVAGVVLLLAVRFWVCADARDRPLYAWLALMLLGLGEARMALAVTYPAGSLWLAASRILRFEGVLFALMGVNRDLHEQHARQATALRRSQARVRSIEAQREAERQALEERQHDVRSALFAIGGVADLLGRSHDELDAGTVDALTHALGAEVSRLQELVAAREREEPRPFPVCEVIEPVVLLERSSGHDVTLDVDDRLVAVGRPTETVQVLRNLLDNAARYAPGTPVEVRGEVRDDWVVVTVADKGPGVPVAERRTVFERARRGSTSAGTEGSGLGLYVASRLMREQGGDLWVADNPGGGAAFAMSLPAAGDGYGPRRRRR